MSDTRLDLRPRADTGAYIERRIVGQLSSTPGVPFRHRISTRPGGVVDAMLEVKSSEYSDLMTLDIASNGAFLDGGGSCNARVRAVVPTGECEIRVNGSLHINEFTRVYREPR
jgi:hypothetical protein